MKTVEIGTFVKLFHFSFGRIVEIRNGYLFIKKECMKRLFVTGGLAIWLFSCANGGNGSENGDSTASSTNVIATDPRDTVELGYGAGANGNAATDTNASSGAGGGRMMSEGAAGTEKTSGGGGTGTGGADSSRGGNRH
jgi:hypothetical protein